MYFRDGDVVRRDTIAFYGIMIVGTACLALSIVTLNQLLIAITGILVLGAAATYKLWYIIDSMLFRHTGVIEMFGGFELGGNREVAVARVDGEVVAVTAAYLYPTDASTAEIGKIEGVISNTAAPFKLVMQAESLDRIKILDSLETKRNMKEIALSRIYQDPTDSKTAKDLKREIELIEHEIETMTGGAVPMHLIYYIATAAVSRNAYDAEERAKYQIRELANQIAAVTNSTFRIASGADLLRLMQIDSSLVKE